ncbi:MAG: YceI family protein [Saprospirales bacterium]|nr:MAG: YceI family protein [Saprospirales bacterium]
MIKSLFFLAISLPLIGFTANHPEDIEAKWKVSGTSRVVVEGQSNVNEFKCVTIRYEGNDVLTQRNDNASGKMILEGAINMKVKSFDCENRIMTRDLRETLKEDAYPEITVDLVSIVLPDKEGNCHKVDGKAEITLAGETRLMDFTWEVSYPNSQKIRLSGNRELKFSQFNIEPPSKMMGMIRVKDKLLVDFDLVLDMADPDGTSM